MLSKENLNEGWDIVYPVTKLWSELYETVPLTPNTRYRLARNTVAYLIWKWYGGTTPLSLCSGEQQNPLCEQPVILVNINTNRTKCIFMFPFEFQLNFFTKLYNMTRTWQPGGVQNREICAWSCRHNYICIATAHLFSRWVTHTSMSGSNCTELPVYWMSQQSKKDFITYKNDVYVAFIHK